MWLQEQIPKKTCLKEIGVSKYDNHSKLNMQHNGEDVYDHVMSTRNFTLIMNKVFMSSENYEESGYGLDSDLLTISCWAVTCFIT